MYEGNERRSVGSPEVLELIFCRKFTARNFQGDVQTLSVEITVVLEASCSKNDSY